MEAIQLIQQDHREVEQLFKAFEHAEREGRAREQARLVRDLVRLLSIHASIEEQLVYPALRKAGVEDAVLYALEEHHASKLFLLELDGMPAGHERLAAKAKVLVADMRRHIEEEERELLPRLKQSLAPDSLRELGSALLAARRAAPTRPHPFAPDTPPANVVTGAAAALWDRGRDAVRDAMGVLQAMMERAFEQGVGVARFAAAQAEQRGRQAMSRAAGRGREIMADAATRAGEAVSDAGDRAAGALNVASRSAARSTRRTGRRVRKGARKTRGTLKAVSAND